MRPPGLAANQTTAPDLALAPGSQSQASPGERLGAGEPPDVLAPPSTGTVARPERPLRAEGRVSRVLTSAGPGTALAGCVGPRALRREAFPKGSVHCKPISPFGENGLAKTDFLSLTSQNKTVDPTEGNLIVLLHDFYYGQHTGDGQPEQKTHTAFKCLSCLKVLKNVKFMNHMKHHLELEKQRGDSWKNHTTCQHCHRQFPTPFQLQCHIESVHTFQEPSAVCKICELSFETDQVLLQHMKDNHKPGEMPYVCQVCNYRSSAFADVETHFRTYHKNTKICFAHFVSKFSKLQHHTCVIIEDTGKRMFTSVPNAGYSF
ncbi:PREDICTED: LOW QUALITY PROTEIN: zinc finger protein 280B [Lipotes vexillifer]|uniref:LOW QUALITY PROTEIN: zinc finger protein 280B n=1 Tax=Lipotes vexillifer TaxID=118797 RepID=A0A340YGX6_LIPVE|nr:PREDICTED: LOW QUALITY PROTEIN: zinc finger protein 280B [Lipotes vexillifer]